MSISSLGYLIFSSAGPAQWRSFGTEVLGAMETPGDGDSVRLKLDEHPFRLLVEPGDADRLTGMGWELADRYAYDALFAKLKSKDLPLSKGDEKGAAKRCVTEYFTTKDPSGNPLEFYYERTGRGGAFASPVGVSGFVTGEMGLGHVVVPAAGALEETHDFYKSVLGFGDSDDLTITPPVETIPPMRVLFMHAANPRHHSLALFNLPSPTGVAHLMFEMENIDDVGRCLDRVQRRKMSLMASLGRHCNDNMLSFYVIGPGGVAIEIGCDGLQLDWSDFTPTVSTVPDHWGHAYQQLEH